MANYNEIVGMINSYYDEVALSGNDPMTRASDTATSDCGINQSVSQSTNMQVSKSMNGSVRGYTVNMPLVNPKSTGDSTPSSFDSTAYKSFGTATGGGGYSRGGGAGRGRNNRGGGSVSIPGTKTSDGVISGLKNAAGEVVHAVAGKIGSAWAAASAIAKAGINTTAGFLTGGFEGAAGAAYDTYEKWNQEQRKKHPGDYESIYSEDQYGRAQTDCVYVVDPDGNVTMYVPEDTIAWWYRAARDDGMMVPAGYSSSLITGNVSASGMVRVNEGSMGYEYEVSGAKIAGYWSNQDGSAWVGIIAASASPTTITYKEFRGGNLYGSGSANVTATFTYAGKTVYYLQNHTWAYLYNNNWYHGYVVSGSVNSHSLYTNNGIAQIAWTMVYGNSQLATPGVSVDPSSTFFDPSVIDSPTIPGIIQQMNDNYGPSLGPVIQGAYMDDSCNEITINYRPVTIPVSVGVGDIFPISGGNSVFGGVNINFDPQINPSINPDFTINPDFDIHDLFGFDIDPSPDGGSGIKLPDIDLSDLLSHILDILAELLQGAPGGVDVSLDPELQLKIEKYIDSHDPSDPETPPPPINTNPPTIINENYNTGGDITITTPTPIINITLPDPTIPIIIPPWPIKSDEPINPQIEGWPTAMWRVYAPSESTVNAFGAWLWNPNFIDTIKRLFESPIDSVFTLHKVFCTPNTSGVADIVVGSIDSGIPSPVVSSQYTNIDCGSIDLDEYFGNIFDYAPYTILQLYLPFIGIVELDPAYCMRSSISIFYTIDVFTGACVAKVGCKRDGFDVCVYEYSGSCSLEYPVSAGSYSSIAAGILTGAMSAVAGGVGTYITGNPLPAIHGGISALHQIGSGRAEIRHTGSLAGTPGAMGIRKPYLIISRPILELADNFPYFDGYPANQTVQVVECTGYIKCKECHLNVSNAYQSELEELDSMLKSGIIV